MKCNWLKYFIISVLLVCFSGLSLLATESYHLACRPMLALQQQPVIISLDKYTTASSFVNTLKEQHLIKNRYLMLAWIRLNKSSTQLKAGVYQVQTGESATHFLARVVSGDVLKETFRIIEGTTLRQITTHLEHTPYLTYHVADWSAITSPYATAEGLLLADTYHYNAGAESKDLLTQAHNKLNQVLAECWQKRAPALPYKSAYELLITASILEKEASLPAEKRLIAGVIINRLRKNMPLQMDPTVIYALGATYNGKLTHANMQIDSPYNTYRYRGLPPTPIAMVGKEAIEAAAQPYVSDYLYFVAKGDGSHYFSTNYAQQKQAIAHYLRKQI